MQSVEIFTHQPGKCVSVGLKQGWGICGLVTRVLYGSQSCDPFYSLFLGNITLYSIDMQFAKCA